MLVLITYDVNTEDAAGRRRLSSVPWDGSRETASSAASMIIQRLIRAS